MLYDIELNSAAHYPPRGVVELAPEIERAGFDAIWKGEANSPDPLVVLSGIAAKTTTLKLGTGIVHVHARSATTLGIEAATLQDLSGGRLMLGVGVANKTIASWHDANFDRPLETARRYLTSALCVAKGEKQGGPRSFALAWKPACSPPKTFLAALGPKMSALAGEIADGVIVNMATPEKLAEITALAKDGAAKAGKDPAALQIAVKVRISVSSDPDRAWARMRALAAFYTVADHYREMLRASGFAGDVDRAHRAFQEGGLRAAAATLADAYLERLPFVAARNIAEIVDRLSAYELAGATRIILPYVPASDDPLGEAREFVQGWAALGGVPR